MLQHVQCIIAQGAYSGSKPTGMPALEEKNYPKKIPEIDKKYLVFYKPKKILGNTFKNAWFILQH